MSPQPTADTRQTLLMTAMDLWLKMGWNAFSYKHLADALGIRKASIHYHFPSKEDLGLALIAAWREGYDAIHDQLEAAHSNVAERIEVLSNEACPMIDNRQICPAGVLDADLQSLPESMQRIAHDWAEERLTRCAAWLEEGRDQGSLHFHGTPAEQATLILTALQGSMQLSRTLGRDMTSQLSAHLLNSMRTATT